MYNEELCLRCGSAKKISKTWKQAVALFSGAQEEVEMSQIECTNEECQLKFDTNRSQEREKYVARKLAKEEQDKVRKENLATSILKTKKVKALNK